SCQKTRRLLCRTRTWRSVPGHGAVSDRGWECYKPRRRLLVFSKRSSFRGAVKP
ncbi:hypothetical protein HPB47_018524, partial [Ixodes persulcatus]